MTRCTAVVRARLLFGLALAALIFLSAPGWGSAAEAASVLEAEVPESLPQESEPDRVPEANLPYLFAVFIITWAVFFGYVFVMSRRQNELRQEIDALKQRLAESEGAAQMRAD